VLKTTVTGPGILSFWWRVSSESDTACLAFSIDGVEQHAISGTANWRRQTYQIPRTGEYELKWEYSKDGAIAVGDDAGWLDQVLWEPTNDVYETKVSARTSTVKEMNVNIDVAGTKEKRKIHYRAPVSKSYAIVMAYDGRDDNAKYTSTGYGRMWASDKEKAFTFGGKHMTISGQTPEMKPSVIGAKGQNIPVEGYYHNEDDDAPALFFSGVATMDPKIEGRIASYTGVVHGTNIHPACCAVNHPNSSAPCNAEQGVKSIVRGQPYLQTELVWEVDEPNTISGLYYPAATLVESGGGKWKLKDAHFFGSFTSRYNLKFSKMAGANRANMNQIVKDRVKPATKL